MWRQHIDWIHLKLKCRITWGISNTSTAQRKVITKHRLTGYNLVLFLKKDCIHVKQILLVKVAFHKIPAESWISQGNLAASNDKLLNNSSSFPVQKHCSLADLDTYFLWVIEPDKLYSFSKKKKLNSLLQITVW